MLLVKARQLGYFSCFHSFHEKNAGKHLCILVIIKCLLVFKNLLFKETGSCYRKIPNNSLKSVNF